MYTDGIGTLKYKLYLSSALRERPALFVMLHGASQTASDFAIGTRMAEVVEQCGGIALFPEQSRSAHPLGSWNWYDTRHLDACSGCFRLERLPGGPCTHWKAPPLHGARRGRVHEHVIASP